MTRSAPAAEVDWQWHVIYTKPRREAVALVQLERQGYVCYLPQRSVEKLRRGRRMPCTEPLFPRYLFIHLDSSLFGPSWAPIRSTVGVSHMLRFGDTPVRVDDGLIECLRRQEQLHCANPQPLFNEGERVRILAGPYAGLSAVFQMHDGDERALVLIELLRRTTPLRQPLANLRREVA